MNNTKAYFLMREDLNMSTAKLGINIGHGVDMIWQYCNKYDLNNWMDNSRKKIVLKVSNEGQLNNAKRELESLGFSYEEIWDIGLTEFGGNRTLTGIVMFPTNKSMPPKIKRLRLWRD